MQVIPLSEGSFTIDRTKVFIPFDTETDDLQKRTKGSLLVEIQPFIVKTKNDLLLLDTGLGFTTPEGNLQLHQNMLARGINPMEITKVLISHLHKDHAGGLQKYDAQLKQSFLSFPQAVHYVSEAELLFANTPGNPSFQPEQFNLIQHHGQVVYLPASGVIDGYISHQETAAHSPHHQVFWIKEENEIIFFGADDAPQHQQMKSKFVAKYDFDGKKAMELRSQWWQQSAEEHWSILFYHDISTPKIQR